MLSERKMLQDMLDILDAEDTSAPAIKGITSFMILKLVIAYLIQKARN